MEILRVEHLSKKYGSKFVNKDISFSIERGSIYGLIGKNGAGKTTLLKQIMGFIHATSGRIIWNEGERPPRVGICIDTNQLNKSLSAYETLRYYGNSITEVEHEEIEEILKMVGLFDDRMKKTGTYSAGMKQKMLIAIALLGKPEFLILDEPTNSLDLYAVREVRRLLVKLNQEEHITMMISSHNLCELAKMATHYGILSEGELVYEVFAADIQCLSEEERELYMLKAMEKK